MNEIINLGICLAFAVIFIVFFSALTICIIKCYDNDIGDNHDHGSSDEHVTITIKELPGINPFILRSISVFDFNSQDFEDRIECVVCLSELADGDKARVLPTCNHWFHADCIDTWFQSHSTCPICRKRVGLVQQGARPEPDGDEVLSQNHDPSSEPAGFPTNPLPTTNVIVIEDHNSDEANEVRPDMTAVVVDIPAKTN